MTSSSSSSSSSSSKTNNGVDATDISLSVVGGLVIVVIGYLNWMLFHERRQSDRGADPGAWTRVATQVALLLGLMEQGPAGEPDVRKRVVIWSILACYVLVCAIFYIVNPGNIVTASTESTMWIVMIGGLFIGTMFYFTWRRASQQRVRGMPAAPSGHERSWFEIMGIILVGLMSIAGIALAVMFSGWWLLMLLPAFGLALWEAHKHMEGDAGTRSAMWAGIMSVLKYGGVLAMLVFLCGLVIPKTVQFMFNPDSTGAGRFADATVAIAAVGIVAYVLYKWIPEIPYYSQTNLYMQSVWYFLTCTIPDKLKGTKVGASGVQSFADIKKKVQEAAASRSRESEPGKKEPIATWVVLALEVVAVAMYIWLGNRKPKEDSAYILYSPRYTDKLYALGTSDDITKEDAPFLYNYAISVWFWIIPQPPNQSASVTVFTSLCNFGDNPNIQYLGSQNILRITMKDQEQHVELMDDIKNVPLQKWNHLLIQLQWRHAGCVSQWKAGENGAWCHPI